MAESIEFKEVDKNYRNDNDMYILVTARRVVQNVGVASAALTDSAATRKVEQVVAEYGFVALRSVRVLGHCKRGKYI